MRGECRLRVLVARVQALAWSNSPNHRRRCLGRSGGKGPGLGLCAPLQRSDATDMASLCQVAARVPLQVQMCISIRCGTGNATEPLVSTRVGCATVVHADIRGLDTSRQI